MTMEDQESDFTVQVWFRRNNIGRSTTYGQIRSEDEEDERLHKIEIKADEKVKGPESKIKAETKKYQD